MSDIEWPDPMATVISIPSKGVPDQVSPKEIWAVPEPSDRQVWAVCPYLRNLERCAGCSSSEYDGHIEQDVTRGCRALAEEACRVVIAAT